MKFRSAIATFICAAALSVSSAFATSIDYFTGTVTTTGLSELGRPSRSGIAQSWTTPPAETYSGTVNPTVKYYYNVYSYSASLFTGAPYVEVSFFDETNNNNLFISAYAGSYNPLSPGTNWLGDEGSSGNIRFFSSDPGNARVFDVILPVGKNLVLIVNNAGTNGLGTNALFDVAVNAFADTMGTDAPVAVTPEPSTLIYLGSGMLAMVGVVRRRFRTAA